jgi:hypothetical protein
MPNTAIKLPGALEKFVAAQVREGTCRSGEGAIVAGPARELDIEEIIHPLAARTQRAQS